MMTPIVCEDESKTIERKLLFDLAMAALDLVECDNSENWGSCYVSLKSAVQDAIDAGIVES